MLKFINTYLGWRNWSVLYYNSIIENLFIFFYIGTIQGDLTNTYLIHVIFFLLFSIFSTTYGYLINDFADRELDRLHGKPNTFQNDGTGKAVLIITVVFLLSVFSVIPFFGSRSFIILWGIWLFLATFYSLPPFRFKEKGKLGLILVVLAQRVFPVLLLFAAFQFENIIDVLILLNLILARGFSSDINHQLQDYENDLKTKTKTSAVEMGMPKIEKLFRFILEYEKFAMTMALILIAFRLNSTHIFTSFYFAFPLFLYLILCLYGYWKVIRAESFTVALINPYKTNGKDVYQVIHLLFPNVFLSVYFLIPVCLKNPGFALFFVVIIIIYRLYKIETLRNSYLGKVFSILRK